jgi:prevent-host-death family protein
MTEVTIRELRNHGGEVVERAQRGEVLTITRSGKPVARLTALPPAGLTLDELRRRRQGLPTVDPTDLRHDLDDLIDPTL